MKPTSRNTLKDRLRALLYRSFQIILALLVLPYLLIGIYSFQAIRPISTLMLADSVMMRPWQRSWVTLDDMAPTLVQSVMMSEDGRFCSHSGVDWQALNAVVDDALSGERTRGASTIPMQTMKNLFLWSQRSFLRKALEIPQALFADLVWSKRRMLEIYLNIVEWDPGDLRRRSGCAALFQCLRCPSVGPSGRAAGRDTSQSETTQSGRSVTGTEPSGQYDRGARATLGRLHQMHL